MILTTVYIINVHNYCYDIVLCQIDHESDLTEHDLTETAIACFACLHDVFIIYFKISQREISFGIQYDQFDGMHL